MIEWKTNKYGCVGIRNKIVLVRIQQNVFSQRANLTYSVLWNIPAGKDMMGAFSSVDDAKQHAERTLSAWAGKMGWREE